MHFGFGSLTQSVSSCCFVGDFQSLTTIDFPFRKFLPRVLLSLKEKKHLFVFFILFLENILFFDLNC